MILQTAPEAISWQVIPAAGSMINVKRPAVANMFIMRAIVRQTKISIVQNLAAINIVIVNRSCLQARPFIKTE